MSRKIKILVIDSEEIILKSITKALKNNNDFEYVVTVCSSAIESLKLTRSDSFDLMLIDLVLPGMNGIELLRRIRSYLSEIMKSASGVLFKPFTTEEINNMVSQTLKHARKIEE